MLASSSIELAASGIWRCSNGRGTFGIPVFGALTRNGDLKGPAPWTGSSSEHAELDAFLELAADALEAGVNWRSLLEAAAFGAEKQDGSWRLTAMKPPGQHTAVAADKAFALAILHLWTNGDKGEVSFFHPLMMRNRRETRMRFTAWGISRVVRWPVGQQPKISRWRETCVGARRLCLR